MIPGPPALCEGTVEHRRTAPQHHRFSYPISHVWLDPDRPAELCDLHPAWSHRRPAPARYRRRDYGARPTGSLAAAARSDLYPVLGRTPQGPVRMLSQVRRWGWLFNPITVFFVWDLADDLATVSDRPAGVVLEVTNTPWKERTRYPLAIDASSGTLVAGFDKAMHVSPFLSMDHHYRLAIEDRDDQVALGIDVIEPGGQTVLHTALRLQRRTATRQLLGRSIRSTPLPTHRVSAGIHSQAIRLWAKGVPIVNHPRNAAAAKPKPLPHQQGTQ